MRLDAEVGRGVLLGRLSPSVRAIRRGEVRLRIREDPPGFIKACRRASSSLPSSDPSHTSTMSFALACNQTLIQEMGGSNFSIALDAAAICRYSSNSTLAAIGQEICIEGSSYGCGYPYTRH